MSQSFEQRERAREAERRITHKIAEFEILMRQVAPEGWSLTCRKVTGESWTVGASVLLGPRTRRDGLGRSLLEALRDATRAKAGVPAVAAEQTGDLFDPA